MDTLNNYIYIGLGLVLGAIIVATYKYVSAYLLKSKQEKERMARARFVKDVRTEVRKYLEELKS